MRRRAKIDANQSAIVDALRDFGASVQSLASIGGGCPDLLIGYKSRWLTYEIKSHEKALLTKEQEDWIAASKGGPIWMVYTVEQALDILRRIDE